MTGAVVVAFGEIGTKSAPVRRKLTQLLADNLAAVFAARGRDCSVEAEWSRLFVTAAPDETTACAQAASEVPGVVWARPAVVCEPTLSAITETLTAVSGPEADTSFAVRANRTGPTDAHDFSSADIEVAGGSALLDGGNGAVDLDDPDVVYRVECRPDRAFVSTDEYEGPGGLPVGSQGTVVALVSGGIDSPVAAWQLLRRGCQVRPVYVDLGDYGGADHRQRAVETVRTLRRRAPNTDMRLRVVPGGPLVSRLVDEVGDTRMLSLRRAMLSMAAAVADREGAHAVATGESMGQKSSQTGPNLAVTDAAVDTPVHRPLLTWDKSDIVAAARALGTYDDSTLPVGCERVAPPHPETNATLAAVASAEPDDLFELAADAARAVDYVEP